MNVDKMLLQEMSVMETEMMATLELRKNLVRKVAQDSWTTILSLQRTLPNEESVQDYKDPRAVHLACICALVCKEQIDKFLYDLLKIWYRNLIDY